MIDINKLKLTDMNDFRLIPQLVEEVATRYDKEQEKYIYKMLHDLKIDKDILKNQVQEIHRLNDILREYKELEEQGLLKKYDCAIGDTVYRIDRHNEIFECIVVGIKQQYNTTSYLLHTNIDKDNYNIPFSSWLDRCQIGYEFYLTKEEAEKELKRLECAE
jgi:hypothetical protein